MDIVTGVVVVVAMICGTVVVVQRMHVKSADENARLRVENTRLVSEVMDRIKSLQDDMLRMKTKFGAN
jgi:hypothetical protein